MNQDFWGIFDKFYLQPHFPQYLIHNRTSKTYRREILLLHEKHLFILKLMAATCVKKVGTGQQKARKVSGTNKKQLAEHFTAT